MVNKWNRQIRMGCFLFLSIVAMAIIIPLVMDVDPYVMTVAKRLHAPSAEFLLGTDAHGRDLLFRLIYGARISLWIGFLVTFLSLGLGTVIGLYASAYPILDHILMRLCDGLMAIPGMLLAIALMSAFGASAKNVIFALVIVYTPSIARIVRSIALKLHHSGYVLNARVQGAGVHRILWKHIFPNTLGQLAVQATYIFASSIISEASLSFLGAGIPAPEPSWGSIIQGGKNVIYKAWWLVVLPSLCILLSVISLHLIGEGTRNALDPTYKPKVSKRKTRQLLDSAQKSMEGLR